MPANRFNNFTDYGIGIGLRVPHYQHILGRKPVVDWFEIISENFMVDGGRPLEVLDQILEQYRVVQHGVAMYFGSADRLNREHLKKLKRLVKRTKTPWLSDHLVLGQRRWTLHARSVADALHLRRRRKITAQKIREVSDFLEVPICVENVSSYAEFHASEMTEWEFLSEVVERADCGILLDVNNIYVSSQNHNFDPYDYLNNVPHDRVGQIHIAGHSKFEKYILDTHDHPVLDPVWKLYAHAMKLVGRTATLLEWDDRIPTFEEVHHEALKANRFVRELTPRQKSVAFCPDRPGMSLRQDNDCARLVKSSAVARAYADRWRRAADAPRTTANKFIKPNDRLTSFERLEIYNRQYWFRLIDCFYDDYPGLRAVLGDRKFDRLARAYLARYPSESFSLRNLGRRLEKFLRAEPKWTTPHQQLALDMARLEWAHIVAFDEAAKPVIDVDDLLGKDPARVRLALQPYITLLDVSYPVDDLLLAAKKGDDGLRAEASNAVELTPQTRGARQLPPTETRAALHRRASHESDGLLQTTDARAIRGLARAATRRNAGESLRQSRAGQARRRAKVVPILGVFRLVLPRVQLTPKAGQGHFA